MSGKHSGVQAFFDDLWNEVLNTAEQSDTAIQPSAKRPKKLSSQFNAHCVLSTVGQRSDSEREKIIYVQPFSTLF